MGKSVYILHSKLLLLLQFKQSAFGIAIFIRPTDNRINKNRNTGNLQLL